MSVASVEQKPARSILRSILAVLAGFVTVFVLSTVTDMVVESTIFPQMATANVTDFMLAIALAYRCVITIMGGYVTARLAPRNPITHAIILGVIGFAAATAGMLVMWNIGHHWYAVALVVTAVPCTWLGGKLAG